MASTGELGAGSATDSVGVGSVDASYQRGLGHLQAGEWQEAIESFEETLRRDLDHASAARGLEEARWREGRDAATRVKGKRWIIPWRSIAVWTLIGLAVLLLAIQGGRVIVESVLPPRNARLAEARVADAVAAATVALEAGDLDRAEESFLSAIDLAAEYESALDELDEPATDLGESDDYRQEAQEGLALIHDLRGQLEQCSEALELIEAGNGEAAREVLNAILARWPQRVLCDPAGLIQEIDQLQACEGSFAEAGLLFEDDRCAEAVELYEQVRSGCAGYQRDAISSRLFGCYLALGQAKSMASDPQPERLPEAIDYLRKALQERPGDRTAKLELSLAQHYQSGYDAYQSADWHTAAAHMDAVYRQRPDYMGEVTLNLLYDGLMRSGDRYLDDGDPQFACEQYRRAAELPVANNSWATGRHAQCISGLTPTPTRTPTATPTRSPTRGPTAIPTAPCGDPLKIVAPYIYVIDREKITGSADWQGHLGIFYQGGCPPYKFAIDVSPPQETNYLPIKWQICRPIPLTARVWSADGQEAHQVTQLPGWCP